MGQGVFTPFSAIDNDFSESFCIGFLVNTSLTNTAPLAYFHDGSDLGILGNITVEAGTPGSITLSIKGAEIVFDMDIEEDFERFQLCYDSEENEMTLYDGCSAVEGSLNFPEFSFEDTDSLGLLRDLASSQPAFQVTLLYIFLFTTSLLYKYTHMYTFPLFRTVSHNSTSSVVLDQVLHRRAWPKCSVIPVHLTVMTHLFP